MTKDEIWDKWVADIRRRSFKDGVEMPLALLALGLCGEAAEVAEACAGGDVEQIKLELGDCHWYVIAIAQNSDATKTPPTRWALKLPSLEGAWPSADAMIYAGKAADRIKKFAWHGKPLDVDALGDELVSVTDALLNIGGYYALSREDVALANMAKLDARYPGGKFVEGGGVRS